MLSGSFCDPQGEQENGEVFRRVDTYVSASINFSSTLRSPSPQNFRCPLWGGGAHSAHGLQKIHMPTG